MCIWPGILFHWMLQPFRWNQAGEPKRSTIFSTSPPPNSTIHWWCGLFIQLPALCCGSLYMIYYWILLTYIDIVNNYIVALYCFIIFCNVAIISWYRANIFVSRAQLQYGTPLPVCASFLESVQPVPMPARVQWHRHPNEFDAVDKQDLGPLGDRRIRTTQQCFWERYAVTWPFQSATKLGNMRFHEISAFQDLALKPSSNMLKLKWGKKSAERQLYKMHGTVTPSQRRCTVKSLETQNS